MRRYYYSATIGQFLDTGDSEILGTLAENNTFPLETSQRDAWLAEVSILKSALQAYRGRGAVYFEYSVPRLGGRIDVVAVIDRVIFVLEFKVGETRFMASAVDQVWDYALDLKNFHESSHHCYVAPVLIATSAEAIPLPAPPRPHDDRLFPPIKCNGLSLADSIGTILKAAEGGVISVRDWEQGRYCPTPTIIEAAMALYGGHSVEEISRSDAGATNLTETSEAIAQVISEARSRSEKAICFVTGVPGAGKTLVGLNVATEHIGRASDLYSVFLSGNGPLVTILREALARDKVRREAANGRKMKRGQARSEVKAFIQNVHHFRDECLVDRGPPIEHVAIFDEAQRAWDLKQTVQFMRIKKRMSDFGQSEPQFLISCLDRHRDWAVIVCLVGGGQEINTGEAGISEWLRSLEEHFPDWHLYVSSRLTDSEYAAGRVLDLIRSWPRVTFRDELHLSVSMRSFRAEHVSLLVKQLLDLDVAEARETLHKVADRYPITVTRDLQTAKSWLRERSRGSERYGIVVSSKAERLKPHAIDVKSPMDPVHWFLDGKEDVRSSYYLEDVATEFHVQGLELDWACVTWDADFRYTPSGWEHWSFSGDRWKRVKIPARQMYLKNAYRVLLTRARQGMVIVVPQGEPSDPTRDARFYDATYDYLCQIGFKGI